MAFDLIGWATYSFCMNAVEFTTGMIADIRQCLQAGRFEPFFIVTSSGNRYRVATADHAGLNPQGRRVVVWFDDESSVTLSGLHITALEREAPLKAKAA